MKKASETSIGFIVTHSFRESLKRKCYFIVCLLTCYLVCLVSLISNTILSQGPIIFLMIAEQNSGEIDIIFESQRIQIQNYPESIEEFKAFYAFMNYTKFIEEFEKHESEYQMSKQSTFRIEFPVSIVGKEEGSSEAFVNLNIINTDQETKIELGRSYALPKMKPGECILHKTVLERMNIDINSESIKTVFFRVDFTNILVNNLIETYFENKTHEFNENITDIPNMSFDISFPCKLVNSLDRNYGKFSEDEHQIAIMEADGLIEYLSNFINNETVSKFPDFPEIFKQLKISDFSNQIIVNFYQPRVNSYLVSSMDELQFKGVVLSNKIIKTFGQSRNYIHLEMPLINSMKPLFYGSIFLGLILNLIFILLFLLSLILIHSLLVITTETNTFTFGILRMLGTTKRGVILIIIIQCLSFSIPAFILAYMSHFFMLDVIASILSKFTENGTKFQQDPYSIIFACLMCLLGPLIAGINPIRNLLNKNLSNAINTSLNKSSGVRIQLISLAEREKTTMITFGLITFLYGASIYYFLPLSLLSINLNLLLLIFLWILMGILLGFVILSLNVENLLQKILTNIFFIFSNSYTKILIIKNLTTHRIRNRQTSLMYSMSVGFFIMITVGLDIELKSLTLTRLLDYGAYAQIQSRGGSIFPRDIYNSINLMKENSLIEDYTYISKDIADYCFYSDRKIMNKGKSMDFRIDVYAISPNFYEVSEKAFLIVDEDDNKLNIPLGHKLYLNSNNQGMGISGIMSWEIDLHLQDTFYFNLIKDSDILPFIFKPSYILHSSPALRMSAEPSTMYTRAVVIPIHTYIDIANKCKNYFGNSREDIQAVSFDDYPINKVLLKLNSEKNKEEVMKKINDIVWKETKYSAKTWFYWDYEKKLSKVSAICNIIFSSVSILVLIFCFFNLLASMTINIYEQRKEIAILRSIGLTSNSIIFIYISEAFILILSSSVVGLVIGSLISWTMALQRVVFTNLPVHFELPVYQLILVLLSSIIGGFLSTIFPARNMLKSSISELIRK